MSRIIYFAIAAIVIVMACKSSHNEDAKYLAKEFSDEAIPVTRMDMDAPPPPPAASAISAEAATDYPVGEQKLIKTAYINMEVSDYSKARLEVDSLVKLHKAWIQSENFYNYDYRITNDLTIRVPSVNLDNLAGAIQAIAKKIEYQGIETADVTEEYIDVQSRLKNQKLIEQKFLGLLRRTDSIDDILKIETKLAEVRGQIESIEGRLKYLNSRVNYSTINLNVFQRVEFKYEPEPMESFWERLKKSLDRGWKGFIAFLLFLIRIWPLWIIGVAGWFAVKWFKNRKKKGPTKKKKKKKTKERVRVKEKEKKYSKPDAQEPIGE